MPTYVLYKEDESGFKLASKSDRDVLVRFFLSAYQLLPFFGGRNGGSKGRHLASLSKKESSQRIQRFCKKGDKFGGYKGRRTKAIKLVLTKILRFRNFLQLIK